MYACPNKLGILHDEGGLNLQVSCMDNKCTLASGLGWLRHCQPHTNSMAVESMECEEFADYLSAKGLHEEVVSTIVGN